MYASISLVLSEVPLMQSNPREPSDSSMTTKTTASGSGGMGSHKHGVSGKACMPPGLKQRLAHEENARQTKQTRKQRMHDSVRSLMKDRTD